MKVRDPHSVPVYKELFKVVAVPTIFCKVIMCVALVATKLNHTSSSSAPGHVLGCGDAVAPVIEPGVTKTQSKP